MWSSRTITRAFMNHTLSRGKNRNVSSWFVSETLKKEACRKLPISDYIVHYGDIAVKLALTAYGTLRESW